MPTDNAAGLSLTEQSEDCILYAYDDADGKWPHPKIEPGDHVVGTLTIGYGHTGPDVHPGMVITQEQADLLLVHDLQKFEIAVNNLVTRPATPNQFAAMVDFAFNVGAGQFATSKVLAHFNAGDFQAAADDFQNWVTAYGKVLPGLVTRRAKERALFLTP